MPIVIIDYEMGNLRSVQKGFECAGFNAIISRDHKKIANSRGLVFPGVGAFDAAMKNLKIFKLAELLKKQIKFGKPFLGICLGLQLLFERSEEGKLAGLGIFKGEVKRFRSKFLKIPQIGWNQTKILNPKSEILKKIPNNSYFYFVHSYYVLPKDKSLIASTTDYGIEFVSSIAKDNIFGVQFHPEKSSSLGLKILKNFGQLCLK